MIDNSLLCTDKEFLEMYERNIKRVYQICFMHMKSKFDAEDATQAIFLKFIQSPKIFEDIEHEKAWFIVITQNHCRDLLRHWWHSHVISLNELPEIYSDNKKSDYSDLVSELLSLPAKYKMVLYLYYFEGYSVRDISVLLKRNESTIRTQLSKGRERLKINLEGYYEQ